MKLRSVRIIAALALFALFLFPVAGRSAVYFTSGFEGSCSGAPTGWTYSNSPWSWTSQSSNIFWYNYNTVTPHGGSAMAWFDAYNFYPSGGYGTMMSPAINLTTSPQSRLSFWYMMDAFNYGGSLNVLMSSDGGATWNTISTITSASNGSYFQYFIAIPPAYRTANFKFGLKAVNDWYDNIAVDDAVVDDGIVPIQYCSAGSGTNIYMGIANVTFNTLNNSSSCTYNPGGYQDFTGLNTNVIAALNYTITVSGCGYDQFCYVFIDWNQNGTLNDPGEVTILPYLPASGTPSSAIINVPPGAMPGPTRMRVRTEYYYQLAPTNPCGNTVYGETEDYTVTVLPGNNKINVSPTSLSFTAEETGALPAPKSLAVSTVTTPFAWTTTLTQAPVYFSIAPTTGTGTGTVVTSITTTNIAPGTYNNGNIRFSSTVSGPTDIPVTYTVVPRVAIASSSNPAVVKLGCAPGGSFSRTVQITNTGGHFNSGVMMWQATSGSTNVTVTTPSGSEGGNLSFTVNTTGLQPGNTYVYNIIITAYNSATNVVASNSPYILQVSVEFEPTVNVSQTKAVGVGSYTQFTNPYNQLVGEMSSNTIPITSVTWNMIPCTVPQGFTRIRYVRRIVTFACSDPNPNVSLKYYYTTGEAYPLVTNMAALQLWQQPNPAGGAWVLRGGSSFPNLNQVTATVSTGLTGTFALAQPWFPKPMTFSMSSNYDRATRNVVLQWNTDMAVNADGFSVERMKGDNPATGDWDVVGNVSPNSTGHYGYAERVTEEGTYQYRLTAIDREGNDRESRPFAVNVSNAPVEFALEQNFPNPFNPTTSIRYSVPQTTRVSVKVYDMMWREVAAPLVDEVKAAGVYDVSFDASALPSGTYFYRMEAGAFSATKKMALMK